MADNKNSDSDYEPGEESVSEDSESSDETDVAMEIIQCKMYLVFESELEKLFSVCGKKEYRFYGCNQLFMY